MAQVTLSNGQVLNFPDSMSDDEIHQAVANGNYPTEPTPEAPQQAPEEESSITGTIGAGWNRMAQNTLGAMLDDDSDLSRYQMRKAQQANVEYRKQREGLGTVAGIAADVGTFAPVVAAGMVAPELGAVAMGGMTTADTLAQQAEQGSRYDVGSALGAGIESGIVDYATAGLGNKFISGATRPLTRKVAQAVVPVAQPAVSNANSTIAMNLATNRPWDENVGQAAGIGALTGGVMHTGAKVGSNIFRGLPEALDIRPNAESAKAAKDADEGFVGQGVRPSGEYQRMNTDYSLVQGKLKDDLKNVNLSDEGAINTTSQAIVNTALNGGTVRSVSGLAKMFKDAGMPAMAHGYDIDVNHGMSGAGDKINVARDILGQTPEQLRAAGEAAEKAKTGYLGTTNAIEQGATKNSFNKQVQDSFWKVRDTMNGSASHNTSLISQYLDQLPEGSPARQDVTRLKKAAQEIETMTQNALQSGKKPDLDELRMHATDMISLGKKTGLLDKFKAADGSTAGFNPVNSVEMALLARQASHKLFSGINQGTPDVYDNKVHSGVENAVTLLGAVTHPVAGGALALRQGVKEFSAARGRKNLLRQKAQGAELTEALASGDLGEAGSAASQSLKDSGINVGEPTARPQTEPTQPQPSTENVAPEAAQAAPEASTASPEPTPRNHEEEVMGDLRREVNNPSQAGESFYTNRAREQAITDEVGKAADKHGLSTDEVYRIINENGGAYELHRNNATINQNLTNMISKDRAAARERAKAHKEEINSDAEETAKQKAGETRQQGIDRVVKYFTDNEIPQDTINKAIKEVQAIHGDEYTATQLASAIKRIHEKTTGNAPVEVVDQPTMSDARRVLERHAAELGVADHPEIKAFIDEKVKPVYKGSEAEETGMRTAPMRTAMARLNKMSRDIKNGNIAVKEFSDYVERLGFGEDKEMQKLIKEVGLKFSSAKNSNLQSRDLKPFLNRLHKWIAFGKEAAESKVAKLKQREALTESQKKERKKASDRLAKFEKAQSKLKDEVEVLKGVNEKLRSTADEQASKIEAHEKTLKAINNWFEGDKADEASFKQQVKEKLHSMFEGKSQTEFEATAERMDNTPPDGVSGWSDAKAKIYVAHLEAAAEGYRNFGNEPKAKAFESEAGLYQKAWERKEKYGAGNKSLYISSHDFNTMREHFQKGMGGEGEGSSNYIGTKGVAIRTAIFGNKNTEKFIARSNEEIAKFEAALADNPHIRADDYETFADFKAGRKRNPFADAGVRSGTRGKANVATLRRIIKK